MPARMFSFRRKSNAKKINVNGSDASIDSESAHTASDTLPSPYGGGSALDGSEYAARARELLRLRNKLRNLGAEEIGLDLPKIVVIGCQSAGKSSLVEAVTGVNVPRDSGTCTRCPTECTISSGRTWSCSISLAFANDIDGIATRPVAFCSALTDKSQVELWLRRAQLAILNPHRSSNDFASMNLRALKEFEDPEMLRFSKSAIQIEIREPDGIDLSFVDLPGLIQNADDGSLIDLIRDLAKENIKGENTLILVTVPMSDDLQNQEAMTLARSVDPSGTRTVVALTKPDVVLPGATGALKNWVEVLQGQKEALKHGYYCIKLSDDAERALALSKIEVQAGAAEFFRKTRPWSTILHTNRFGVPTLVKSISKLLIQTIEKNLPKLRSQVANLLQAQKELVAGLSPAVSNDPRTELGSRISHFCSDFRAAIYGERYKHFVQKNRATYATYKTAILSTVPDFRPSGSMTGTWPILNLESFEHDFDDDDEIQDTKSEPMDFSDVKKTIQNSIGWELPGHVPFEATSTLIKDFVQYWGPPTDTCFDAAHRNLIKILDELGEIHFGSFQRLKSSISGVLEAEAKAAHLITKKRLKGTLDRENVPFFSQNVRSYERLVQKWLARYTDPYPQAMETGNAPSSPRRYRVIDDHGRTVTSTNAELAIHYLAQAGYGYFNAASLRHLHIASHFEKERAVMANVRAYFDLASKRIVDCVPLTIEHEMNQAVSAKLDVCLFQFASARTGEELAELVAEDPDKVKERIRETNKLKALESISTTLLLFGRGTGMS